MSTSRRHFLKTAGLVGGVSTAMGLGLLPKTVSAAAIRSSLPYYLSGAPLASDLRQGTGEDLILQGTVFGPDGKTPLSGATVEIWHCNPDGTFDFSKQYLYRGKTTTNQFGRYTMKTNAPGRFEENGHSKMRRIFVLVSEPNHQDSFSQLYLTGNLAPSIDNKQWAASPMAQRPSLPKRYTGSKGTVVVYDHFLRPASIFHTASGPERAACQLRLYPITGGRLALSFGALEAGHLVVHLTNKRGQLLQTQRFHHVSSGEELAITPEALPSGVYTCSIYSSRLGRLSRRLALG